MRRTPTSAAVLLAGILATATLLSASPAAAIGHHGMPHPSADYSTLYAHYDDADAVWYLATVTGPDVGYVGGIGTTAAGQGYTWTIPLEDALAGDLILDTEQNIDIYAYVGRTGQGGVGRVTVSATLTVGDTVVAAGSGQTVVYVHEYQPIHWSVSPAVDRIPADGGDIVLTITVTDGVRNGVFLRINDPDGIGASRIELPITAVEGLGGGPDVVTQDLAGDTVELVRSFDEAADAIHQYNWTAPSGSYDLAYDVTVTNGTVALIVESAAGTVLNQTLDAAESSGVEARELEGNVSIRLTFSAFQGDVAIRITPSVPEPVDTPAPAGNDTATPAGGNNTTAEDGGSVPSLGIAAATAAVAFVVLVAARRRG